MSHRLIEFSEISSGYTLEIPRSRLFRNDKCYFFEAQNPKSESMDFFAEIDHISIKMGICGKQSKFNVITNFGGTSPHQF